LLPLELTGRPSRAAAAHADVANTWIGGTAHKANTTLLLQLLLLCAA
jgi:hypothetical protein